MAKAPPQDALAPVHPGEILLEDFLKPYDLTAYAAAQRLRIPRTRIERLTRCATPVTVDTALRLARLFDTSPHFWMALQSRYDLAIAEQATAELDAIEPIERRVA